MVWERAERCPFWKACAPYARLKTFTAADPGLQTIRQGDAHLSCHTPCAKPSAKNDERLRGRWESEWQNTEVLDCRAPISCSCPWCNTRSSKRVHPDFDLDQAGTRSYISGFPKSGYPQSWFFLFMENYIYRNGWFGVPLFRKHHLIPWVHLF